MEVMLRFVVFCVCYGNTCIKIGTIQRRLPWPMRKDDTQYASPTTTLGELGWYKTAQQQGNGWRTSSEFLGLYSISQFYLRLLEPEVGSRLHEQKMTSLAETISRPLRVVKSYIRVELTLFYAEHNRSRGVLTRKKDLLFPWVAVVPVTLINRPMLRL